MSNELQILKKLLLKEELEVLENLKNKLLSQEQFSQEVSKVLTKAIIRAQKHDKDFEKSLYKPISNSVKKVLSRSKQSLIDALLPIMGQLIRKTVANNIRQFVSDINRTIELGFSSKALKWRWQALKSGKEFSEIVFQKTIRYQVQELFVINRNNGLLIDHVGVGDMLKDKNAISAMLTAIQDFIGDSVKSTENGLLSAEIDNNIILISTGPIAYLASVIKGSPTERLREKSQQLIENLHAEFSHYFEDEEQYQKKPEFKEYLQSHLITKNRLDEGKKTNWLPWISIVVLIIFTFSYWGYKRNIEYNEVLKRAQSTPGFFLQSLTRKNSGFELKGLLDPVADTTQLQGENIKLISVAYLSLEPEIIKKRVALITKQFPKINITYELDESNKSLGATISGRIDSDEYMEMISKFNSINGLEIIENQITIIPPAKIKDIPQKSTINVEELIKQIVSYQINYSVATTIYDKDKKISEVAKKVNLLINQDKDLKIVIIGQSDCNGSLSNDFSLKRANLIFEKFANLGVPQSHMSTKIKKCDNYNQKKQQLDLRVSFQIEKI